MKRLVVTFVCILALAAFADADIIAQFTFPTGVVQTNAATTIAGNVTPSLFNVYSNAVSFLTPATMIYSGGNPVSAANKSGNLWYGNSATNGFYGFTLTLDPGYALNVIDLRFDGRATASGVTNILAQYSVDNVTFFTLGSGTYANDSNWHTNICNTSVPSGLTGTNYFRIYGFGTNGAFNVDNVTMNGTVIPEPGSMALIGIGMLGLIILRRKVR